MAQKKKQAPTVESVDNLPPAPPIPVLSLTDRVREAMRAGLRAIVASEVSKIDASFELAHSILVTTYKGFKPDEMPLDFRMVSRDLHVFRDKKVEELTFRATEDFRLAMDLVEWAIEERQRQEREAKRAAAAAVKPAPVVAKPVKPAKVAPPPKPVKPAKAAKPAKPAAAPAPPKEPKAVKPNVKRDSSIPPRGLSDDLQLKVLRCVLKAGAVRTSVIRQELKLDDKKRPAVMTFLRWAESRGLLKTSGERYGFQAEALPPLADFLKGK